MANVYAGVGNPRDFDQVDYGNGQSAKKTADGKWQYDALGRTYDDVLGDNEFQNQLQLKDYRAANPGAKIDQGDAGATAQMNGQAPVSPRDSALQSVSQTYSSAGAGSPSAAAQPTAFTNQLRDILMQQLGQATQPVSPTDPGISQVLAGQRLALQRSAERQQGANAERLAGMGLADSGAAETGRLGIEQQRGEAEAQGVGQVLSGEMNQRRQQVQNLLQLALATGDTESARQLQAALAEMQHSEFGANLNQQNNQFNDQLAFGYTGLNNSNNLATLNAILGLGA